MNTMTSTRNRTLWKVATWVQVWAIVFALPLPRYIAAHLGFRVSLLHCDLDVYEPTVATLRAVWPRLVVGGIAVFDQYAVGNWGESDAVDEFFAALENPPRLQMLPSSPTPTAFCVKTSRRKRS